MAEGFLLAKAELPGMCSILINTCAALTNSKGDQQKAEVLLRKYLSKSARPLPIICGLWQLNFFLLLFLLPCSMQRMCLLS